jgi:hypothetical protein
MTSIDPAASATPTLQRQIEYMSDEAIFSRNLSAIDPGASTAPLK